MRRVLSALCLSTALGLTAALPAHAADVTVTPTAPTVVDQCGLGQDRVTIPDVPGAQYLYETGGMVVELTPGEYAGLAFIPLPEDGDGDLPVLPEDGDLALPDARATITVEAREGYVLADGVVTSFDVSLSSAPCAAEHSPVTATSSCGQITFANPAGNPEALIYWGDVDSEEPQELSVPAGGQLTVDSAPGEIVWFAQDGSVDGFGWTVEGATTPDEVATEQDRQDLIDIAELVDLIMAPALGDGFVEVEACASPGGDDTAAPTTPEPTTPEIPKVVQTDGVVQHSPVGPLALGGLAALAGFLVLRPRRQD